MAGIRKDVKIKQYLLTKEDKVKLAHEIAKDKYKELSVGGIVSKLNNGFNKTIKKSISEVLIKKGVIIEGRDIRCLLKR